MDDRFLKFVNEATIDSWKLTVSPQMLDIQKESDFIDSYEYMNRQSKVHLLLQFSIFTPSFWSKHKDMIIRFINLCVMDEDNWVSETAITLFKNHSDIQFEPNSTVSLLSNCAESATKLSLNVIFSQPIPDLMHRLILNRDDWKSSLSKCTLPPCCPVSLRILHPPEVSGRVGQLKKRGRTEPSSLNVPPAKKVAAFDTPKIKIKSRPRASFVVKKEVSPPIVIAEKTPMPPSTDMSPLSPANESIDAPFVQLLPDEEQTARLRQECERLITRIERPSKEEVGDGLVIYDVVTNTQYCYVNLFVNILRQMAYEGVQNEVYEAVSCFICLKTRE